MRNHIMRSLRDIFLSENSILDDNPESIKKENMRSAQKHMHKLFYNELDCIPNEQTTISLLRFVSLAKAPAYECVKNDIHKEQITLSNPFKYNDPMDPILRVWLDMHEKDAQNISKKHIYNLAHNSLNNLRICCLSDIVDIGKNEPLMWSHYADSHRGIAIKYNITGEMVMSHNDDEHLLRLCKVAYRDRKPLNDNITIDNALIAKSSCWEYEGEYRLIYFSVNDNDFKTSKDSRRADFISLKGFKIGAIYLGTRMDSRKEDEIKQIAQGHGIDLYKMMYSRDDISNLEECKVD